jgi:Stress responsive A/B Barrel Domain
MIQHNVFFKWKPSMTSALEEKTFVALRALKEQIPGIISATVGKQNSPEGLGQGFTVGLSVQFCDAAARDAYLPHPAHQAAVALCKEHIAEVIVLDYAC